MDKQHYPTPFDFVPFSQDTPQKKDADEWEADEWEKGSKLLSGNIEYSITPLTPLHIVGKAARYNKDSDTSYFARRMNQAVIPGSSIKGMVRSFFEALTNSWVSHATDLYPSINGKRHLGFSAYNNKDLDKKIHLGPAIPERLHPEKKGKKIDLASFLFGNVMEDESKPGEDSKATSHKSRLIFDDILFDENLLTKDAIKLPDIKGEAFMGGPKPCIGNWWYFEPLGISERRSGRHSTTEFIGDTFRGRKFYYHQYPQKAISWYLNSGNWPQANKLYSYSVETIGSVPDQTVSGKIYFERVPETFLKLFLSSLQPKGNIRHKIGYGKAFGLGSIEISVDKVWFFDECDPFPELQEYDLSEVMEKGLSATDSDYFGYIDKKALACLTRILSFDDLLEHPDCMFVYPPFARGYFQTPVQFEKVKKIQRQNRDCTTDTISEALFDHKKTIDFRLYQERSLIWDQIEKRE